MQAECEFRNVIYTITASVSDGSVLTVELEQLDDLSRWQGNFPAACAHLTMYHMHRTGGRAPTSIYCVVSTDVEDMTLKSYSYKKFGLFVRMLLTALRRTSDSVSLDLLTSDDLDRVKARRSEGGAAIDSSLSRTRKRYLILTYTAEYDRVQYPLPLQLEEQPDVYRLQVCLYGAGCCCVARIPLRQVLEPPRAALPGDHKEAAAGDCRAEGSGQRPGSRRVAGASRCCRAAPWCRSSSHQRATIAAEWLG